MVDRSASIEGILGSAVDTMNTAHGLLLPIVTLCDDITAESLTGQEAWHRAEACIALAEKASGVLEEGLRKLYAFPVAPAVVAPDRETSTDHEDGAQDMVNLLREIGRISSATCERPEGRDWADMQDAIDAALLSGTCGSSQRRYGFTLALAHLLCINADGGGVRPEDWDPLTSLGRERARGAA